MRATPTLKLCPISTRILPRVCGCSVLRQISCVFSGARSRASVNRAAPVGQAATQTPQPVQRTASTTQKRTPSSRVAKRNAPCSQASRHAPHPRQVSESTSQRIRTPDAGSATLSGCSAATPPRPRKPGRIPPPAVPPCRWAHPRPWPPCPCPRRCPRRPFFPQPLPYSVCTGCIMSSPSLWLSYSPSRRSLFHSACHESLNPWPAGKRAPSSNPGVIVPPFVTK